MPSKTNKFHSSIKQNNMQKSIMLRLAVIFFIIPSLLLALSECGSASESNSAALQTILKADIYRGEKPLIFSQITPDNYLVYTKHYIVNARLYQNGNIGTILTHNPYDGYVYAENLVDTIYRPIKFDNATFIESKNCKIYVKAEK